ncbi:hypothetical protein RDI58_007183 [Solanum bulbocastanum]|uniref:Uncharacterized protein n=1 Tax=Solanum bulbocastanum TaxID=147425 RepID=A0AAN8TTK2_SOLBU
MYLTYIEKTFNHDNGNADGSSKKNEHVLDIFSEIVRPFKGAYHVISKKDFDMARRYVLNNCEEVEHFINGAVVEGYHANEVIDFYGTITDIIELEHIYEVPEMQNYEVESDESCTTNDDVYQDVSVECILIDNDIEDVSSQLHRDDVNLTILDSSIVKMEV